MVTSIVVGHDLKKPNGNLYRVEYLFEGISSYHEGFPASLLVFRKKTLVPGPCFQVIALNLLECLLLRDEAVRVSVALHADGFKHEGTYITRREALGLSSRSYNHQWSDYAAGSDDGTLSFVD